MNSKKVKEIAKKRLQGLFSSNKGNDKGESKIKWDINKEFNLNFHDKAYSEQDILLNPDTFQGVEENSFIEVVSTTNPEIRILFKIKKQCLEKIKSSISILATYNELIKNQNENFNKSSVFVRPANVSDYFVEKMTILFKEHFISRKDIFQITQSMIDSTIYVNKEVKMLPNPDNDETAVATVTSFKVNKMKYPLTGVITSSTDFQLGSLSSGIFFLVEISKDTFDFSYSSRTKFELVIEFLKNALQKLKEAQCSHIINIIFFTRIYFKKRENRKLFNKKNGYSSIYNENVGDFIYQSTLFPDEYFFDLYSSIIKLNINKLDIIEMAQILYKAFNTFSSIFKVKNLSQYMTELNKGGVHFEFSLNSKGNGIPHFNNIFSLDYFEDVDKFRLTKSNTSNMFEAVNILVNDLKYEKKKMYKLGNIINIISSGEYFPYYNYRLSKITKENLFEQGVPLTVVFLANKNKTLEIYKKDDCNAEDSSEHFYSPKEDRYDREQSFFSLRGFNTDENDIRIKIANNNDILNNLNDRSWRKNSLDISHKDSNLIIQTYRNEADVFSHVVPKWMKLFFVTNYNYLATNLLTLNKNPKFNLENKTNFDLTFQHSSNSLNYKSARKLSVAYIETTSVPIPENIDNDIFNSKKRSDYKSVNHIKKDPRIEEEYHNLQVEHPKRNSKKRSSKNKENDLETIGDKNTSILDNKPVEDETFDLETLKGKLNIYNPAYNKSKLSKDESKAQTNEVSASPEKNPSKINLSEYTKTDEYKELIKRVKEYENDIFSKKASRKNSYIRMRPDKSDSKKKTRSKRDILHSFEFSEENDDFSMIVELLKAVPLLPIFGEFNTEMKEDVRMAPHQLSSLNSDCNILEEIIFERINNNYQIVKPKNHHEDYNKVLDLKTVSAIQLFDRRFFHMILAEDQNYKVQIFNYSKIMNKFTTFISPLKQDENRHSLVYDSDFNYMDYSYFMYEGKFNVLFGKKMSTKLGEKNEVYWSKYDIWLNDLQLNMKQIKFRNEVNFLVIDKTDDVLKKRRTKAQNGQRMTNFSPIHDLQNFRKKESTPSSSKDTLPTSLTNSPRNKLNHTSENFFTKGRNFASESAFPPMSKGSSVDCADEMSYKDRVKSFVKSFEQNLEKYPKFNDKFSERIVYVEKVPDKPNNLVHNLIFLKEDTDWILVVHNEYFNEKNSLFLSLRWLSCNSLPLHNISKDISKKSRNKNLCLVKIPCDDITLSNFKKILIWKTCPSTKLKLIDNILGDSLLSNFIRCEFEGNYIYFNEEYNLLFKISQKGFIFLHDGVVEQSDSVIAPIFLDFALQIDIALDLFDYMNHLLEKVENMVKL